MSRIFTFCALLTAIFISSCEHIQAQVPGCTDPQATNYNSSANKNDGSCTYAAATQAASVKGTLPASIHETSGLIFWNGMLWTHNDDGDTALYAIDTADGHILRRVPIKGVVNNDWEDLAQDNDYIYIGDFGNNGNGNRTDLKVLKIAKAAIVGSGPVTADRIVFNYADQTDFSGTGSNKTDFDCEAFVAAGDSLYLFTKQWVGQKSKVYSLSKDPGIHTIRSKGELNVQGLVSGATYLPNKQVVALCGYTIAGFNFSPFVYLLYDFTGNEFFSGNKRKITVTPAFHQIEGIATADGKRFFVSNEELVALSTIPARLQRVDLSAYLNNWYQSLGVKSASKVADTIGLYPNPSNGKLRTILHAKKAGALMISVYDSRGAELKKWDKTLKPGENRIELEPDQSWASGQYFFAFTWDGHKSWARVELQF